MYIWDDEFIFTEENLEIDECDRVSALEVSNENCTLQYIEEHGI